MRRVGFRMKNSEAAEGIRLWRNGQLEVKNRLRGEAIMKRVGGRMRNKEASMAFNEWNQNYKNSLSSIVTSLQLELSELQLKFSFVTQSAGESIMRNVAQRLLNAEIIAGLTNWKDNLHEIKSRERGEAIMRRVGLRMKNREAADAVTIWREQQLEVKNRLRGEAIMKRVGGRMRNKEVALCWGEWVSSYRGDKDNVETAQLRRSFARSHAFAQQEIETLKKELEIYKSKRVRDVMRAVLFRLRNAELGAIIHQWSRKFRGTRLMRRSVRRFYTHACMDMPILNY
jgi:hypothetical protein